MHQQPITSTDKLPKVLVGADPELFAFHKETGEAVSVHDKLPGSKDMPVKVPLGAIQVDGLAAEFNIEPADNSLDFMKNINHVRRILTGILNKQHPDLILRATPVADFFPDYLASIPFEAKLLGCEPDFNAYTGEENPKPDASVNFRTGSGHIHLGWTENQDIHDPKHFKDCCEMTKELDFLLYNSSHWWDKDQRRRSLYGKQGAFRPKPYGLEYRVLSNAWLDDQRATRFVFHGAQSVARKFLRGFKASSGFNYNPLKNEAFYEYLTQVHLPSPVTFMGQ